MLRLEQIQDRAEEGRRGTSTMTTGPGLAGWGKHESAVRKRKAASPVLRVTIYGSLVRFLVSKFSNTLLEMIRCCCCRVSKVRLIWSENLAVRSVRTGTSTGSWTSV